jgi:hypothetical protein
MATPVDGKVTDFGPLPLPVQGTDVLYIIRNGVDLNVEAGVLWSYFNSTTTTMAPTTTVAP